VDNIGIIKTADHMGNDAYFPYMGQKLVAQALAPGGALYQSRYIHKFNRRRNGPLGLKNRGELFQPVVWYIRDAYIGVDGTKGILAASAGAELRAEKMVDFPTLGSPTIPQFRAMRTPSESILYY
jgi:hypothetical protein